MVWNLPPAVWLGLLNFLVWFTITGTCTVLSGAVAPHWVPMFLFLATGLTDVIVSHLMKTPFCVLYINLYYVKLSAKRIIHVAPMSIFLTLN